MANTTLNVSLQKASQQLTQRIALGQQLITQKYPKITGKRYIDLMWDSIKTWDDYNNTFLRKLFSDESVADKYENAVNFTGYSSLADYAKKVDSFYRIKMRELNSIKERLKLYTISQGASNKSTAVRPFGDKVFIVHGHDETTKQSVARFLEKLDLDVVILHEHPDEGKTIIEKLESHSSEVDIGYAVVLLTPDDMGMSKSNTGKDGADSSLSPRARQNVVFELGYFISRLGRKRVRALYVEGVELPSDYKGVLYTQLDNSGAWKLELAREIKAAGIYLDLNKIV